MNLNLSKREKMKKLGLGILSILISINLYAQDDKTKMENIDKLDVLDKQSKEFFKAITGLEKDYLEEQITDIKNKKEEERANPTNNPNPMNSANIPPQVVISQEDYEKNVFKHQNELARLTTDFTRTKKLKDLKIKSMYSFNGKDYVVLKLEDATATNNASKDELSTNIEGRYVKGDYILGHKITKVDVRTKSIELYKKLDSEYGYSIYLSNYGISVGDLEKIEKEEVKETNNSKVNNINKENAKNENSVKNAFEKVANKDNTEKKDITECLYTVNVANLNVRNTTDLDATILRILKVNDQFTVKRKIDDWVQLDTIYKKISGDVMAVENQSNWIKIADDNVSATHNNCF